MIVDLRTYTTKPGMLTKFLGIYKELGWPIQLKYLPKCLGYYVVEIGHLSRVVHVWEYQDIAERMNCRAKMETDPGWPKYLAAAGHLFETQENRIMKPVPLDPVPSGAPAGIVEKRTYAMQPGKLREWAQLYQAEGYPIQRKHLGSCIGFYQSDIGAQHQIVHLWTYPDLADRQKRRAAMYADPAWQAFAEKTAAYFTHQENEILRPAPFWPPA